MQKKLDSAKVLCLVMHVSQAIYFQVQLAECESRHNATVNKRAEHLSSPVIEAAENEQVTTIVAVGYVLAMHSAKKLVNRMRQVRIVAIEQLLAVGKFVESVLWKHRQVF